MSRSTAKRAFRQARDLAARGEPGKAAALYREILREFPDDQAARAALAGLQPVAAQGQAHPPRETLQALAALYRSGQFAALARECRLLLQRHPASFHLWSLLGAADQQLGRLDAAAADFRNVVEINPRDAQGHYNLGVVCHMQGKLAEAEAAYRAAADVNPNNADALNNLGHVLNQRERFAEAADVLRRALTARPRFGAAENNLGNALRGLGQDEAALEAWRRALSIDPKNAQAHGNIGALLVDAGRLAEAKAALENALALKPDHTGAFLNLCRVTQIDPADPIVARMQALHEAGKLDAGDRSALCFALAEIHDRQGETEKAFALFTEANALRKRQLGYAVDQDRRLFAEIRAAAPGIDRARITPDDAAPVRPVFILGMPRSGTTLVEQIVSAHPEVSAGGELDHVRQLGVRIATGQAPATPAALAEFRQAYLGRIAPLAEGRGLVTDKMPQNFLFVGLMAAALPEAKILHVTRDPAAVCWSNFRQHFTGTGMGYSNDLGDVVAYHGLYRDLMRFWRERHPGVLHEVDYEALVSDPQAQTRALIAALGLAWDEACLAPEKNARAVRTASKMQVRQAVYRDSSRKWRRYAPCLDGAFDALARP